jgi:hypothetical protein
MVGQVDGWLVRSELRKRAELGQAVIVSVLDVGV